MWQVEVKPLYLSVSPGRDIRIDTLVYISKRPPPNFVEVQEVETDRQTQIECTKTDLINNPAFCEQITK